MTSTTGKARLRGGGGVTMANDFSTVVSGDIISGPARCPRNATLRVEGSIHEDATAQKLGFRDGQISGSLHMEQFPPLLQNLFGPSWWETGGLSLYFRHATMDTEHVQARGISPKSNRTQVWLDKVGDHNNDQRVAEGTANIGGPDKHSALRQRITTIPTAKDLRILSKLKPRTEIMGIPTRINRSTLDDRLEVITESSLIYSASGPWGRPVLPPSLMVQAMRAVERQLIVHCSPAAALFGAIEVQHISGPMFADTDYEVRGSVIAVSDTPETEYFWYESVLSNGDGDVASMLMMLRFMKTSSTLWDDAKYPSQQTA